ncbi:MAG: NUDIX hydrolase [Caldilineaceae bacterium]
MEPWKTLARTTVLQARAGKYLTVENHRVGLPDGRVIEDWAWLITPDFVNVVAVTEVGEFICFRQPKYAAPGLSLALAGGYLEPGEEPLAAAQRELLEETGYVASDWTALGSYVVDGNRGCGHAHLFLAHNARWVQPIDADDLEEQELLLLSRQAVETALQQGEFKVLPWSATVALALLRLNDQTKA